MFGHKVRARSLSPAPGGPPLYSHDYLLEADEEDSEVNWVDEEEEEEDNEQDYGHTLRVTVSVPDEGASTVNHCELSPARLQQSRLSFFLSGLLVMALTVLWLAFI